MTQDTPVFHVTRSLASWMSATTATKASRATITRVSRGQRWSTGYAKSTRQGPASQVSTTTPAGRRNSLICTRASGSFRGSPCGS